MEGDGVEVRLDPGHRVELREECPCSHVSEPGHAGGDDPGVLIPALDRWVGDLEEARVLAGRRIWGEVLLQIRLVPDLP